MDYEVFMLTRMREVYDETGDTSQAIALGLSRTGKLVTSAALVLCLAFFVLSTGPGTDIKQFGIGLSAGVIFDATVIRALLVPSLMQLLGSWNWVFPHPVARLLLTTPRVAPQPIRRACSPRSRGQSAPRGRPRGATDPASATTAGRVAARPRAAAATSQGSGP